MPAAAALRPAPPVETIRALLKGQVSDILRASLPELRMVPRDKVYDTIMADPHLLHQGFQLMRAKPELFKSVMMTSERKLPTSDEDTLICGRTLSEIIALVVRACARRYFKKRLVPPRPRPLPMPQPGFWHSVAISLGLITPPRPVRKVPSAADRLYQALRDMLRFEWQVPLIPTYAALSPQLVNRLGEKLLDYRDPMKVQALADPQTEQAMAEGKIPLLLDNAKRLMVAGSDNINPEVLWSVCQKMRMAALFPGYDTAEMRKAVSMVAATSPAALKYLMPVLGDDIRKFSLYLFTAYGKFGPVRYRQVLGATGQGWMVESMARRIAKEQPLTGTHEQWKATVELWLDSAVATMDEAAEKKAEVLQALDKIKTKS